MRKLLLALTLMLVATPAAAQSSASDKLKDATGQFVFVIDAERREWQGRLIKVSAESMEIEGESGVRTFVLSDVRRVDADGDSPVDGAVKGALFGAVLGAISGMDGYRGRMIVGGAAIYGLVGLGIDAAIRCKQTVYRGPASPHIAMTMKFSW